MSDLSGGPFQIERQDVLKRLELVPKLIAKRNLYIQKYKKDYMNHLKYEYNMIHRMFPGVIIYPEARIKSWESYYKKIDKLINKEYASDIYDIFACRYVIDSVNGSKEDEDIIPVLYAIRDLIAYGNPNLEVMPERIKDYVEHPKHNDYQSLHVTSIHKDHHGFVSETQLRSYFMHEIARNGNASHANTYKDRIPGVTEVPIMFEYVLDENGFCTEVKEMSREKAYEKFFGEPYDPEKDAKSRHDK